MKEAAEIHASLVLQNDYAALLKPIQIQHRLRVLHSSFQCIKQCSQVDLSLRNNNNKKLTSLPHVPYMGLACVEVYLIGMEGGLPGI